MKNLKKYTKTELIERLKSTKESVTNRNTLISQIKTYLSQIWELILTFKGILIKLTLISFFIQIFKKYRLFKRLWFILNTIVMSIFCISLLDNFGLEFFSNFFNEMRIISANIVDYLSNTSFYTYLWKLFSKEEDLPSSEKTGKSGSYVIGTIRKETETNGDEIREGYRNSKISEWLKPEVEEPKIDNQEVKEVNSSYKKYYIIAGVVVLSCLVWNYSDEIKSSITSTLEWILSFRPGAQDTGGSDSNNSTTPTSQNFQGGINSGRSSPGIEFVDKGKSKVLTSPSFEDLNSQAKVSWGESSGSSSPESTSSTETVTPSNYSSNFTEVESLILTRVDKEWKDMCPGITRIKMRFIEDYINKTNSSVYKKLMTEYLCNIETETWRLIDSIPFMRNRVPEIEIYEVELILIKLNNLIHEYHDKLFHDINKPFKN